MLFGYGAAPSIVEEHDSAPSLIAAVEIGRGLAIVPSCLGILAGGRLKFRPLEPAPSPIQIGAVFDPQRLSAGAAKFLAAAHGAAANGKAGRMRRTAGSKLGRK